MAQNKVDMIYEYVAIDKVTAKLNRMDRSLGRFSNKANKRLNKVATSFDTVGDSISKGVLPGLVAIGSVLAVDKLKNYADSWVLIDSKLQNAGISAKEVALEKEKLRIVANRTRQDLLTTADGYSRIARATNEFGISSDRTLKVVELVNKAVLIGGTSAQEASQGIIQLSQGFSSNRLQGDELRSVLENLPAVARTLARGLKEIGLSATGTTGEMRGLASQGVLTSEVMIKAFESMSDDVEKQFGKISLTIGQATNIFNSAFQQWLGEMDESVGGSEKLANSIISISQNIDVLGKGLLLLAGFEIFRRSSKWIVGNTANIGENIKANKALTLSQARQIKVAHSGFVKTVAQQNEVLTKSKEMTVLTKAQNESRKESNAIIRANSVGISQTNDRMKALRKSTTKTAIAMRGLNKGLAFFGGGAGFALTGIALAFSYIQSTSSNADASIKKYRSSFEELGISSDTVNDLLGETVEKLENVDVIARQRLSSKLLDDLNDITTGITNLNNQMTAQQGAGGLFSFQSFSDGAKELEKYVLRLNALGEEANFLIKNKDFASLEKIVLDLTESMKSLGNTQGLQPYELEKANKLQKSYLSLIGVLAKYLEVQEKGSKREQDIKLGIDDKTLSDFENHLKKVNSLIDTEIGKYQKRTADLSLFDFSTIFKDSKGTALPFEAWSKEQQNLVNDFKKQLQESSAERELLKEINLTNQSSDALRSKIAKLKDSNTKLDEKRSILEKLKASYSGQTDAINMAEKSLNEYVKLTEELKKLEEKKQAEKDIKKELDFMNQANATLKTNIANLQGRNVELEKMRSILEKLKASYSEQEVAIKTAGQALEEYVRLTEQLERAEFANSMNDALKKVITTGGELSDVFDALNQKLLDMAYDKYLGDIFTAGFGKVFDSLPFKDGGAVQGFSSGGAVRGAGTGTSDSIRAKLSNGEYVINAKSAKRVGRSTLDAINSGQSLKVPTVSVPRPANDISVKTNVNVVINNSSSSEVTATQQERQGGGIDILVQVKESIANDINNRQGSVYNALKGG